MPRLLANLLYAVEHLRARHITPLKTITKLYVPNFASHSQVLPACALFAFSLLLVSNDQLNCLFTSPLQRFDCFLIGL